MLRVFDLFLNTLIVLLLAISAASVFADDETGSESQSLIDYSVIAPLADESLLLDAVTLRDRIVSVGERGHILVSTDSSESWQQARVPVRSLLTAVFFIDDQIGWAVGHDAVILKTTDGGINWRLVYSDVEENSPLLDVWFSDSDTGFAVGAYSLFLRTVDGGETWVPDEFLAEAAPGESPQAGGADEFDIADDDFSDVYSFHLNAIHETADGLLFIASEAGNLYRSSDRGKTWQSLNSPYEGSFFSMMSPQPGVLLVMGLRGNLYRSMDNGDSWQRIESHTKELLTGGVSLADGTVLVCGLGGVILASHDKGETFRLHTQAGRYGYSDIVQASDGNVLVFGESGISRLPEQVYVRESTSAVTSLFTNHSSFRP